MSKSIVTENQLNGHGKPKLPDPEVLAKAKRRQFSASYKLRIMAEADSCQGPGEVGALLRREGLYSSHLSNWRKQQREGRLSAGKAPKRGRRKKDHRDKELAKLKAENDRLKAKLVQAETIIDVQKKLATAFGLNPSDPPSNDRI